MIQRISGYILAGIGFLGAGFFKTYNGSVIPYPILWLCSFIVIGLIGFYLVYSSKMAKNSKQEKFNAERLAKLKQTGEKILLTTDNCEVRENNYYEEEENEGMSKAEMIDASFYPERNYKKHYVEQSAIIYYYNSANSKIRMTSPSFPVNAEMLSSYIEREFLYLYVNRFDKTDYVFELKNS